MSYCWHKKGVDMIQKFYFLVILVMTLGFWACSSSSPSSLAVNNNVHKSVVKIAILADQGVNGMSAKVLNIVKNQKADMLLINGDFDYKNDPVRWERLNRDILGEDFPILAVVGNHDVPKWSEYQKIIQRWQQNPKFSCSGEVGVMNSCTFEGVKIVLSSPGIFSGLSKVENENFIKNSFAEDKSIWRICGWHKNMKDMQTGSKSDDAGWGVYEECRKAGALITTGHEHAYARSYLLSDIPQKKIVTKSDTMTLATGQTVVILSGLGGLSARPLLHDGAWWAAKENADTGTKGGVLFCSFGVAGDSREAACYFMDEVGNRLDTFTLKSALN